MLHHEGRKHKRYLVEEKLSPRRARGGFLAPWWI